MKTFVISLVLLLSCMCLTAQYEYEASPKHPFGKLNPKAPASVGDYAPLIGSCACESVSRNKDGEWAAPVKMNWTFTYIMNGTAVQDKTLKADGGHSGSIRQYDSEKGLWYVHYYSTSPSATLQSWEGKKNEDGDIILYNEQTAPNGMEGFYKITFSNISEKGFEWLGAWVNLDDTFSHPLWKISCKKIKL
ncbi:MAG: hypothetical protein AAFY71_10605 [Bacteroidota bacterium]